MNRTNLKITNKDIVGKVYGDLEIISIDEEKSKKKKRAWVFAKCKCGKIISVSLNSLKRGNTKSCGCRKHNFDDLTGKKYGEWTVLSYAYTTVGGKIYWNCRCSCGTERVVLGESLKDSSTRSCGCKTGEFISQSLSLDLTNKRFGKLVALERDDTKKKGSRTYWKCQCDCGNIAYIQTALLINGNTSSCGCRRSSYGEEQIEKILKDHSIVFIKEFSFKDLCGDKKPLRFNFAIFKNDKIKYLIECQGPQHFSPIKGWGGEEAFKKQKRYDNLKVEYCKNKNIPLILINFSKNRIIKQQEVIKEELLC